MPSGVTISSEHVSQKESKTTLDGSVVDPETGTKITAGVQVEWSFAKSGAMTSEFALVSESSFNNFAQILDGQFGWLAQQAKLMQMGSDNSIAQGFCVVTSILLAESGLNVGSETDDNKFSISGSASGVEAMLGRVEGKGSYAQTSQRKAVAKVLWPDKSGTAADPASPAVVAYTVASFDGGLIIPNWTQQLSAFTLVLNNKPGCTYIVEYDFSYTANGARQKKSGKVSGGLTSTIGDIPLTATDLELHCAFKGVTSDDKYTFKWAKPLGQWTTGQRHIDLTGVWPGQTHAVDREAASG